MKRVYSLAALFFFLVAMSLQAQIYVNDDGGVGIGATFDTDTTKLLVTSDGMNNTSRINKYLNFRYTGSTIGLNHKGICSYMVAKPGYGYAGYFIGGKYGLYSDAVASGTGDRYGLVARGLNSTTSTSTCIGVKGVGATYGVYAYAKGTASYKCALYATVSEEDDDATRWAAVFDGPVSMTNTITYTSDAKFKENFESINNALNSIKELQPKSYTFKQEQGLKFPKGEQYGFTAQDMEKVLPDLVTEVKHRVYKDPDQGNDDETAEYDEISYKSINYNGLFPFLVKAIQEQQSQIEKQQAEIEELKKLVNR